MSVDISEAGLPDPIAIQAAAGAPLDVVLEPFGTLTTTDEVRAIFGLSSAELSDDMLMQPVYISEVKETLLRIRPELFSNWGTLQNERLLEMVKRVALYSICNLIGETLPLIAARVLTDSKASIQRFNSDLSSIAETIRNRLNQAIRALKQSKASNQLPRFMGAGQPSYDPVTG